MQPHAELSTDFGQQGAGKAVETDNVEEGLLPDFVEWSVARVLSMCILCVARSVRTEPVPRTEDCITDTC